MLDTLRNALSGRGYRVFTRPFELNIVGVRSATQVPNAFDDRLHIFFVNREGKWQHHSFPATTDPGTHWLRTPMNSNGTAILKPGQYRDSHALGMHRGKYLALVQRRPVTVIRDFNRNNVLDFGEAKQQTGLFGINIHRALLRGTTRYVDNFSAGCQVFANGEDFAQFIQLCEQHKRMYGNSFTYTLIEADKLPAAVSNTAPSGPFGTPQQGMALAA